MQLAVVWHYWVGVALAASTVLLVIVTVVGYLYKVKLPQYPRR